MSLYEKLKRLYPQHDIDLLIKKIEDLTTREFIHEDFSLSEKDVALITYGDQLTRRHEAPLQTLHDFLNKYLAEIISVIHILPFYPYSSDDGFSVIDFNEVNPELGSWGDIERMAKDSSLMFDAVINHISAESSWVQGYLNCSQDYDQFFVEYGDQDWSQVVRPRTSPLFHTYPSTQGEKRLWTTFSRDQVDLNYQNPDVLLAILSILIDYIDRGARLLRLDAIGFLWKRPGTPCIHLEETHLVIQLIREVLMKVNPHVKLITETNVPHAENISYYGDGSNEAHMVYNFTLPPLLAYTLLSGNTSKFTHWMAQLPQPTSSAYFFNFLASHDGIGVRPVEGILDQQELQSVIQAVEANGGKVSYRSLANGEKLPYELNTTYLSLLQGEEQDQELGIKRMVLAHALLLVMPGLPAIYFHSLVGSENDIQGMESSGVFRRINREKLAYDTLAAELDEERSTRHRIFSVLKELIRVRKGIKDLHPAASFEVLEINDQVIAFKRGYNFQAYFNCTSKSLTLNLNDYKDAITNTTLQGKITLPAYGYLWLID